MCLEVVWWYLESLTVRVRLFSYSNLLYYFPLPAFRLLFLSLQTTSPAATNGSKFLGKRDLIDSEKGENDVEAHRYSGNCFCFSPSLFHRARDAEWLWPSEKHVCGETSLFSFLVEIWIGCINAHCTTNEFTTTRVEKLETREMQKDEENARKNQVT